MTRYRLKGTAGPVANRSYPLLDRLVIGSDPDCDIRVRQGGMAAHHAEVELAASGTIVLRALDERRQTLCNGEPVDECTLGSGDEIRVGQCRLLVQAPGLKPRRVLADAAPRPRRYWPWLLLAALVVAAGLAWQRGWLAAWL